MPLLRFTRAFDLPDPTPVACEPGWLFAQTVDLLTATGLLVWRIPLVHDGARMFKPVRDLLEKSRVEYLVESTVEDENHDTGVVKAFVALLRPSVGLPSAAEAAFVDLWRGWGDIVPIELPGHISARLELAEALG